MYAVIQLSVFQISQLFSMLFLIELSFTWNVILFIIELLFLLAQSRIV